jgi:hypothetical protein
MATITQDVTFPAGGSYEWLAGTIAMDSSYPTGGEALDLAANTSIQYMIPLPGGTATTGKGRKFEWDASSQKLVVFQQKDPAAAGGADIAFPEVANATDLSAITALPFIALVGE